jgi:hypothetical protein
LGLSGKVPQHQSLMSSHAAFFITREMRLLPKARRR